MATFHHLPALGNFLINTLYFNHHEFSGMFGTLPLVLEHDDETFVAIADVDRQRQ